MGQAYIMRRGGRGAAIRLMTMESAEMLPESALCNTLAVITKTEAGHVYIQSGQPEEAQAGDIWAATGEGETFSFSTSRADVPIGIKHVAQYDGAEWKRVGAYAWMDGAWARVSTEKFMLYERGMDMTDATGGWGSKKDSYGKATWNADSLYLGYAADATVARYASVYTMNKVELTQYTKLSVLASAVDVGNGFIFGAIAEPYTGVSTSAVKEAMAAHVTLTKDEAEETVYEADISALSGGYHIQLAVGVSKATIHEIYLS